MDGLFEAIKDDTDQTSSNPETSLRFHEATPLTSQLLERLIRYSARPPFALDRLHIVGDRSDQILYLLPKAGPAGDTALRLSALGFLDRMVKILPSPQLTHPARGPPQVEFDMGAAGGETHKVAQKSFFDDLNQSPEFDPTEPEPVPGDDLDQSWEA